VGKAGPPDAFLTKDHFGEFAALSYGGPSAPQPGVVEAALRGGVPLPVNPRKQILPAHLRGNVRFAKGRRPLLLNTDNHGHDDPRDRVDDHGHSSVQVNMAHPLVHTNVVQPTARNVIIASPTHQHEHCHVHKEHKHRTRARTVYKTRLGHKQETVYRN